MWETPGELKHGRRVLDRGHTVVLLDGGMGQELHHRRGKPAVPLWSAQVLQEDPDLVRSVHSDFIAAGATVITLSSYSVTPARLARAGLDAAFEPLQRAAIAAAVAAREMAARPVAIAGCLPPLVASYRPDAVQPVDQALADYRRIVAIQAEAVDMFVCETLSTRSEAMAATTAAVESGKPVWTAFTVDDADGTRLRSGENLTSGIADVLAAGAAAVLVNCARPEAVTESVAVLASALAATGRPFGAYANGFISVVALRPDTTVDVLDGRHDLTPAAYADAALGWVGAGASIVGGCCEIGPAHIAELNRRIGAGGWQVLSPLEPGASRG